MNDFISRIRWGNVARIAAVVSAIGLVVAWPQLKAKSPQLPPAQTIEQKLPADPLSGPASAPVTTETVPTAPLTTTVAADPDPAPERKRKRKRRPPRSVEPAVPAPMPPVTPRPAPKPRPEFQPFG